MHYLGTYATAEEAARAVDAFWREVDAEHAHLNVPDELSRSG